MPRRPALLTLAAVVAVIVLLDRFGGGRGPVDASVCERSTLTGAVTDVRDGGTVEVAGMPIRLQGVAAPEWDQPGGRRRRRACGSWSPGASCAAS